MPVPTRQPESLDQSTSHPVAVPPPGVGRDGIPPMTPGELLPPGVGASADPGWVGGRILALEALRLRRTLRDTRGVVDQSPCVPMPSDVLAVRAQLAPVSSRAALADSYRREAFHIASEFRCERPDPTPIRLAYALRWLELARPGE
ncbi:MAG TPA: hypothetical protein VFJ80_02975 [Candidatus Limnocylindrales bacterium]|nr:hypothetical protein [Candidatus Limnocylindrales bacterium]